MNILFVTHYHSINGSIRSLLDLVSGLARHGIHPFFAVPAKGSITELLEINEYEYRIVPLPWWVTEQPLTIRQKFRGLTEIIRSAAWLRELIREWNIDLVYTNTSVTPVGRLAAAQEGLPHIWHIREMGDLHFSYQYLLPKPLSFRVIRSSAAVICHAQAVRNQYFSNKRKNIHLVYNGCATLPQFNALLETRLATPTHPVFTFAMLSSLSPRKGQTQTLRALAALRTKGINARLILAGNGREDFTLTLKNQVKEFGLHDQVEFTGLISDPYPLYYSADCVLVCSEHEAFSRAGLEAMSTALPVIAKNSGGSPELLENSKTGILYDTEEELISAMTWMVQYPDEARQMGLAGWERAREKFNIEDYAANVYRVIQSVTNQDKTAE